MSVKATNRIRQENYQQIQVSESPNFSRCIGEKDVDLSQINLFICYATPSGTSSSFEHLQVELKGSWHWCRTVLAGVCMEESVRRQHWKKVAVTLKVFSFVMQDETAEMKATAWATLRNSHGRRLLSAVNVSRERSQHHVQVNESSPGNNIDVGTWSTVPHLPRIWSCRKHFLPLKI